MEIGWLESLVYGLLSGFSEIVPVSSQAHSTLLLRLFGVDVVNPVMGLLVHGAILLAILSGQRHQIQRLMRERRLSQAPKRRRKRQPDPKSLMDIRLLKTAIVPLLLCFLPYRMAEKLGQDLLWLSALLILNGVILYIPQHLPTGNKDSRMLSPMDGMLLGFVGGLGILPGISRIGACASAAEARGADRQYALDIALLLSIPVLGLLLLADLLSIVAAGLAGFSLILLIKSILAAAAAYIGAYFGIISMRFLAVKTGFAGFAYYSWGAALFTFILYLIVI